MKKVILVLVQVLFVVAAWSQCKEWQWPADRKTTEEKVVILQDDMKAKKYRHAIVPLNWILINAPQLNSSIYIYGASIYESLAASEKDAIKKKKYVDSLMVMYDMRMSRCGDRNNVLPRKAAAAFKFRINSADYAKVLPVMDSVFTLYPGEASDAMLLSYMQTIIVNHQKAKSPDEEGVLKRFDEVNKIIAQRLKASTGDQKHIDQLNKIKKEVEEWLFKAIKPDCDFVKAKLVPSFKKSPHDLSLAKRIFTFMLQGKCTEDPVWLDAARVVFSHEKDFGLGKNIAVRYISQNGYDLASRYLDSTLHLAASKKDSSEILFYKGVATVGKGDKPGARQFFLASLKVDASNKEAAEKIGDLYYGSFKDCASMKIQADDRAVYLAAYKWYQRAGDQKKMDMAHSLFPSREEIFVVNHKKGDTMQVGCWIHEDVVIQTRD